MSNGSFNLVPASERLPEKFGYYLCCFMNPFGPSYMDYLKLWEHGEKYPKGFYDLGHFLRIPDDQIYWVELSLAESEITTLVDQKRGYPR